MRRASFVAVAFVLLPSGCRYVAIGAGDGGTGEPMLPDSSTTAGGDDQDSDAGDDGATTPATGDAAVTPLGQAVSVTAGDQHTCALTTTGTVYCWGANTNGQLGDGTTTDRAAPVAVNGLESGMGMMGVTAIAAGHTHTCALAGGTVSCWGENDHGQLGDGTTTDRARPTAVVGLRGTATAISVGGTHTCAVTDRGVSCWGGNADGQLGNGSTVDSSTPVAVAGVGAGATAVAAGGAHTCALESGGAVACWGFDADGQLGNGATATSSPPSAVTGIVGAATKVCTGNLFSCVLVAGGVQCWGFGELGQIGNASTDTTAVPASVSGMGSGVVSIATGVSHACGIGPSGSVWCWGDNQSGQLGNGDSALADQSVAVEALAVTGATALAAGAAHTCVVATGHVLCWGWNVSGQLGDGSGEDSLAPVEVAGF